MLPSTRICVSTQCPAQSRVILSIKELESHKGHSSTSIGQLHNKLKNQLPTEIQKSLMTTNYQTLSSLIHFKCNIMREMITNLETQLLEKSKEFNLMESVSILLNGEYKYLINENIDELLKNINNFHLPDLQRYSTFKNEVDQTLEAYISSLIQDKSVKKETKKEQVAKFIPQPESYLEYTKIKVQKKNKIARHIEGYKDISMRGISELKIKINEVQESYVGIGLGLIKKEIVEKDGLIIQFEEMQKVNHGLYLLFNDKCVYNSVDQSINGIEDGKDKGISFKKDDIVKIIYDGDRQRLSYQTENECFDMAVKKEDKELLFVAWLDLSEIEIV